MTRSSLLSASMLCGLFLIGSCDAAEWKEFTSKPGGFKVLMPGTPTEETQAVNGEKLVIYGAETEQAYYAATYTEMPFTVERLAKDTEKVLDGSRRGMLESVNGKLLKETRLKLDGKHSGRELQAEINLPGKTGVVRARIYVVDRLLINLSAVGTAEAVASPDVEKFLNSLALTKATPAK